MVPPILNSPATFCGAISKIEHNVPGSLIISSLGDRDALPQSFHSRPHPTQARLFPSGGQ